MCVMKDGVRLANCINGTCKKCKDMVFMEGCGLQQGPQRVTWHKQVTKEVEANKSSRVGM